MSFKTKEELIKELNITENRITVLNKAFKSFAERVEFYKKYERDEKQFITDYNKEYEDFIKTNEPFNWQEWKDWLFDYTFGDVIE